MTPAMLARLTRRPAASIPLSRLLPQPVYGALEAIREEVILDDLATLTAALDNPQAAVQQMFGGT